MALFKSDKSQEYQQGHKRISLRDILYSFFIFLLFIGIFIGGHYAWSRINELTLKNELLVKKTAELEAENSSLLQEKQDLILQNEKLTEKLDLLSQAQREEILRQKGINPDILDIKVLGMSNSWEIFSLVFEVKKVYLTPDIADLRDLRSDERFIEKDFLMFEIQVDDKRKSGDKQVIPVSDYLRLKEGVSVRPPDFEDYLELGPGQKGILYTGYAVDQGVTSFDIELGFVTSSETVSLDFEGSAARNAIGVFLSREGFTKEYIDDET